MLRAFIARNYDRAPSGDWFFQNGPQRVYVELEAAPWVWRLSRRDGEPDAPGGDGVPAVATHTGLDAVVKTAWLDDSDRLFLDTDRGFGLVHSMDVGLAADAIEGGRWPLAHLPFAQMPERFGYRLSPQAAGVVAP
jgi:hypothetical protein